MWLLCYLLELSFFIRCFAFRSKICFQFPCLFIFHWINLLNISKTSRKHLKRDVFFVTSLRRLVDTSQKRCFFFETSQIHLKKDVFYVTSSGVSNIFQKRCLFGDFSDTSQKYILKVFETIQKLFRAEKIDVWTLS